MFQTISLNELMTNLGQVSASTLESIMPYLNVGMGIIVAFLISYYLEYILLTETKEPETKDLREENIRAAIQIENSEALEFEEKYGEKVVSQSILENELIKK